MTVIYVAAPYTKGDVAINVRNSLNVANMLAEMGYAVMAPLLSHFWHIIYPHPYSFWLTMDIEFVGRCDAVFRVVGESAGADAEVAEAKRLGIPVFYSLEELGKWKNERPRG